ncbi:radical SAM protein [Candidatus Woesearchaeota archaeon]|nr:radical SAM protein [Candidatus Woesearchaeota archaeon]
MTDKLNNLNTACFERAIFLSWYCSKADCSFCYMSTQKDKIAKLGNPRKARRSFASIFAEAIISKTCGWEVEFLSGGYDSFSEEELLFVIRGVYEITGKKQWLNIGTLKEEELKLFLPYIEGMIGTLECVNLELRREICPSKPMKELLDSFFACNNLGIKKGITVIIGLGETIDDFAFLEEFIKNNNIVRITFYSLNPQKGTIFKSSPPIDYYEQWIAKTRQAFPDLWITAGAWHDKINYYSRLLKAGANNITKIPVLRLFGTEKAKEVEQEVKLANRKFTGTLTKMPKINWEEEVDKLSFDDELKKNISIKLNAYLKNMSKASG